MAQQKYLYHLSTVHCHSTHCDGKASLRQMADAAIAAGVETLGISGHSYVPFDLPCCVRDTAAYLAEMTALKAEYLHRLDLLCGVEWDAHSLPVPGVPGSAPQDLLGAGECTAYDYVIGSSHYILCADGAYRPVDGTFEQVQECVAVEFGGDGLAFAQRYYADLTAMIRAVKPDIVGHLDLCKKQNKDNCLFDPQDPRYVAAAEQAMQAARACGCMLEVNTGGVYRGYGCGFYPSLPLLRRWHDLGGKVVLTADAHTPDALIFQFDEAAAYAKQAGFAQVWVMNKDGFVPCTL